MLEALICTSLPCPCNANPLVTTSNPRVYFRLFQAPRPLYDSLTSILSPFAAASKLITCGAPTVASPPRILTPLPSNTHGPASFRGVMGPSGPIRTGLAPVGEGVLVALFGVDVPFVPPAVRLLLVPPRLDAAAEGIGTGSEVAWDTEGPFVTSVSPAFWGESDRSGPSKISRCDESMLMVTSIRSGACTGAGDAGAAAGASGARTLLADSRDFRGAAMAGACIAELALLPEGCASPPAWSFAGSSESSCSHSSGSSTSASRSAAARQLGHMKMGYDGDERSDLMHL